MKRLERKRKSTEGKESQQPDDSGKRTRSDLATTSVGQEVCFFCGGTATEGNPLSRASTVEVDSRVRAVAMEVNYFNLLGKLSAGDMVALKSQYYKQFLVALYPTQDQSEHSKRLKDKLLASIPGLSAYAKGRKVLLVFEKNIAQVLSESLERVQDCNTGGRNCEGRYVQQW